MEWLTPANVVIVILMSAVGYKTLELLVKKLSLTGTPGTTTMTWLKTNVPVWYAKEWVKASVGGMILIILLALLNKNLAWWLSGHHPRLLVSLVLLVVLGVFVLKKDYDRTKKWLWRVGFATVLVFGVGGAILEDRHNGEPNLDEVVVGGEQREALKEVAQEVEAAMPKISLPTLPSLSPATYQTPTPVDKIEQAKASGKVVWSGNVGPQGMWIPFGVLRSIHWRGNAYIQTDTGTTFSGSMDARPYLPTRENLWFQPTSWTEVVVTKT